LGARARFVTSTFTEKYRGNIRDYMGSRSLVAGFQLPLISPSSRILARPVSLAPLSRTLLTRTKAVNFSIKAKSSFFGNRFCSSFSAQSLKPWKCVTNRQISFSIRALAAGDGEIMSSIPKPERLARLRALMSDPATNLDAYIVPTEDAHQSEYVADCDARRVFISGFTGSSGLALVCKTQALLWTDGRYFLQAGQELDENWTLMKSGLPETLTLSDWLAENIPENGRIGIDPTVVSISMAKQIRTKLTPKKNQSLVPVTPNLVDEVWGIERPPAPFSKAMAHPMEYAGSSTEEKLNNVRAVMKKHSAYGLVVTTLDEIAWFLNMRGSDVSYNPVIIAYVVVTEDALVLYIDERKVVDIKDQWGPLVTIKPYGAIFDDLKAWGADGKTFMMDVQKCNLALYDCIPVAQVVEQPAPLIIAKACKNPAELKGMKEAHIRDAVALCKFLCWLEALVTGGGEITELEASDKLEAFRRQSPMFVDLSFPTIAGSGPNGAIIHYRPEAGICGTVTKDKMFLLDSGAQYRDGTTDVTRTVHYGTPTEYQRECYTRVLKGTASLAMAVFPNGVTGLSLDTFARMALWNVGLDYRHGTGHGVGAFLNVHEGPQGISQKFVDVALKSGMILSNEPGFYEDGQFGIRIENLQYVKEVPTKFNFGNVGYLGFEHLTLVPIQKKLIETSMLIPSERKWLDDYHAQVYETISPLVDETTRAWLYAATRPLVDSAHSNGTTNGVATSIESAETVPLSSTL